MAVFSRKKTTTAAPATPPEASAENMPDDETEVEEETEDPADEEPAKAPSAKSRRPATVAELKAALPKASSDFLLSCVEQGLTVTQASGVWAATNSAQKSEAPGRRSHAAGSPVIKSDAASGADTVDPKAEVDRRVGKLMSERGMTRAQAHRKVMSEDSDLRQAFVDQHNQMNGRAA